MKQYNVVDLFAGAGGLSLGFTQTKRFEVVAAAENNPNARKTYKRNHKNTRLYSDVRIIDYSEIQETFGEIDVVIGGPPCQGFSNANRQHSTIISMNNRLVKEYVRAITELTPLAFVMENVAMLKSNTHRFIVDEDDMQNDVVMNLELSEDTIELLPSEIDIPNIVEFVRNAENTEMYSWDDKLFKIITILYRYRINQPKFNTTLEKHAKVLVKSIKPFLDLELTDETPIENRLNHTMAVSIEEYIADKQSDFQATVKSIEVALHFQRMLRKVKELHDNNIHIFNCTLSDEGALVITVRSYAVLDYINGMLKENYILYPMVLNAADYGAPQKRERFVIVGVSKALGKEYKKPKKKITDGQYHTVRDAIEDLEDVPAYSDIDTPAIPLPAISAESISKLGKKLRGKMLHNHITTATRDTAMARFKALKEGQNFHDLNADMKTTYSNAERTQNTIYMRLVYDEPSGTVVNVRKSMWVHPTLDRAISIREAARLQTFPDSFVFEGTKDAQYQQVGNAVPPFLAKAIAKSILKVLDD